MCAHTHAHTHAAFSSQPLNTSGLLATYNLFWTSLPIIAYAVTEQVRDSAHAVNRLCTSALAGCDPRHRVQIPYSLPGDHGGGTPPFFAHPIEVAAHSESLSAAMSMCSRYKLRLLRMFICTAPVLVAAATVIIDCACFCVVLMCACVCESLRVHMLSICECSIH
eukprot:1153796-Pelagomonas_calceolata.AAC.1